MNAAQPNTKNYHSAPIHLEENRRGLRQSDVFLASFPRSGNTWMKLLLADVILQTHGYPTGTQLPIDRNEIIPDIYKHRLKDFNPPFPLAFRLIKTHERHDQISGKWSWRFRNPRVIYLFREPSDALCSFYQFETLRAVVGETAPKPVADGVDAFCRGQTGAWRHHAESYLRAKQRKPARVLLLSYERLHQEGAMLLHKAAEFLGLSASKEVCAHAFENHRFDKQRPNEDERFFRKGRIGTGREALRADTWEFIERETRSAYERATSLSPGN